VNLRAAALLALAVSLARGDGPTVTNYPWHVGLRGVGPVRYGMTLAEASRALGEAVSTTRDYGSGCVYVFPKSVPAGVSFIVVSGLVERVDVRSGDVATWSGAHIGSTEAEVKALYLGRIQVTEHAYTGPQGHYLTFVPRDAADSAFRIVFETDGHAVTMYRAGRRPVVEYIEGCA
jgi:hypothetical protein